MRDSGTNCERCGDPLMIGWALRYQPGIITDAWPIHIKMDDYIVQIEGTEHILCLGCQDVINRIKDQERREKEREERHVAFEAQRKKCKDWDVAQSVTHLEGGRQS